MAIRVKPVGLMAVSLLLVAVLFGCSNSKSEPEQSFLQVGEFAVHYVSPELTEVRDGAGRTLALVPRGVTQPEGYAPDQIVRVPVRSVVAYSYFDVSTLISLGVMDDVLVGVTTPLDGWHIEEVRRGMESGKIAFVGDSSAIDFERVKERQPELVLTWDPSILPLMSELGIPCVITTTPVAMCLSARMRFVQFLAPFFQREKEASAFFAKVSESLREIREISAEATENPKVMWGDIYEKRVLVEPGNAWVGELVGLAQSDYLFEDVFGTSCIEISVERFLYSGEDAEIYFTYRTPADGATSKAALARTNSLFSGIRPLREGRVYSPRPEFSQSGHKLDEILTEIAAILHPELYPDFQLHYFIELPDKDPVPAEARS